MHDDLRAGFTDHPVRVLARDIQRLKADTRRQVGRRGAGGGDDLMPRKV